FDLALSSRTSFGAGFSGILIERKGSGDNLANWMNAAGQPDSLIRTISHTLVDWKNAGLNFNFKHNFSEGREWTADADLVGYRIGNQQDFDNFLQHPGYYRESTRAEIPNEINIISAKTDYVHQLKNTRLETGWKTSRITTDNLADYEQLNGINWEPDLGKSNHFLYEEFIHAVYGSAETKINKWSLQGGLRYEMTNYKANQLGNAVVKDSSFSRNYNSLFPSVMASLELDSLNQFSFSAGRRIDRPAFQKLNPFLFIINKYTYQVGNPYYRPQFTWNFELSHMYKQLLVTGISYSITDDYFSQVFPVDSNGIVLYTEGNLGRLQNLGISVGLQLAPAKWWSLNTQAVLNHKKMEGVIDRPYTASITQLHLSINNQFRFGKGWSAELSGFYTSKSQHDIQEIVDPAGQISVGIGKTVLQNKGTVRLAARDLFYTQWMKGNTLFTNADEYFKLTRDTRVATISFVYRFGKAFKAARRSQGAAREEMERVGNG
ncbi:MAG: outer membrane beta-barrel family protein, partial [Flavisolibacter sp.]